MDAIQPVTKYEKTRLLGLRATQLANGAKPMTNIGSLRDPLKIAEKEYNEGSIPISIVRTFPNGQKIQVDIVPVITPRKIDLYDRKKVDDSDEEDEKQVDDSDEEEDEKLVGKSDDEEEDEKLVGKSDDEEEHEKQVDDIEEEEDDEKQVEESEEDEDDEEEDEKQVEESEDDEKLVGKSDDEEDDREN